MRHQWELALMLLSLHAILIAGVNSTFQTALVISHFGFFLLWQPVWRTQEKPSVPALALLSAGVVVMVFFLSWWLLAFWISVLFALLGGRIFSTQAKSARLGYLLAAGYMLACLLMWVVPKLLHNTTELAAARLVVIYCLPLMPLGILFTRIAKADSGQPPILDFFYTLLLLLLAIILVLGAFAVQASSEAMYAEIIFETLLGLAAALVVISWLWNPRSGFVGIGHLLSRYLLSVGLPFEQWVKSIAELADKESSPQEFTNKAMQEVLALPWVSGVTWGTADGAGTIGNQTQHLSNLDFQEFHISIHTDAPLTPALTIHLKLLGQILNEFYEAKRREETLKQNVYMQAIYETGSRLTHDIKNLVQSMSALCNAAEHTPEADNDRLLALLRRQLPLLNQRLARTLEKLQEPQKETTQQTPALEWWNALKERYIQHKVMFVANEIPAFEVDAELLDSVLENLLQNALEKSKSDTSITIKAEIVAEDGFCVEVTDTGKAMPSNIAEQLFKKQIGSENGLGVGLYHAGRQAEQSGYTLTLAENLNGGVKFRIYRR
ncbi:sensor histidine kinase KdpD [Methylovorus sp. MM2]|uniref:sensor histidine kinase n=1 Tax=Methylovorus sp. MM2 TaxID=1848038 RepID=UPI0020B8DC7C|nr:ATP-binding protein [Methylovorus sp. MM2]